MNIQLSYDGAYAAYFYMDSLEIMNIKSEKVIKIIDSGKDPITTFKWLPDRDMIIYGVTLKNNAKGVQVFTFDIETGIKKDYPKFPNNVTKITNIVLSPITNVVYAKVNISENTSSIYRFNIMGEMEFIINVDSNTKIEETIYSDNLIYQDSSNDIYVRSSKDRIAKKLKINYKAALLGVSSEDIIYIGKLDANNSVETIYFGKLETNIDDWAELLLRNNILPQNIILSTDGAIFEKQQDGNILLNLKNKNKTSYKGEFIEINNNYIVSKEQDILRIKEIK